MPLFVCDLCQNIDNTALTDYWTRFLQKKQKLCSKCGLGKWHGRFPEEKFTPTKWKKSEWNNNYVDEI